jgi:hypothetical protein
MFLRADDGILKTRDELELGCLVLARRGSRTFDLFARFKRMFGNQSELNLRGLAWMRLGVDGQGAPSVRRPHWTDTGFAETISRIWLRNELTSIARACNRLIRVEGIQL